MPKMRKDTASMKPRPRDDEMIQEYHTPFSVVPLCTKMSLRGRPLEDSPSHLISAWPTGRIHCLGSCACCLIAVK